MNSFIFKGISSSSFGIIVQELPPIVRPRMRIDTITIDGRDGEQINELGYEAYDKSVFIGLRTNQYINQINSWLTGSGDLVFSNEPNMVYKASVMDGYELSRLGRHYSKRHLSKSPGGNYTTREPHQRQHRA